VKIEGKRIKIYPVAVGTNVNLMANPYNSLSGNREYATNLFAICPVDVAVF